MAVGGYDTVIKIRHQGLSGGHVNKLQEFEKKLQQLREKNEKIREIASLLRKENAALKKELKDKNLLLEKVPAGVVLIWRGRILEVNGTFLEYMGYKADEMINRNFLNFVHPDYLSEARFIHNKWSAGKVIKGQYDTVLITESEEEILCSIESKRVRYRGRASYILNITRLEERESREKKSRQEISGKTEFKMAEGFRNTLEEKSSVFPDIIKMLKEAQKDDRNIEPAIEMLKSGHLDLLRDISILKAINAGKDDYLDIKPKEINSIISEAAERVKGAADTAQIEIKSFLRAASSVNGNFGDLSEAFTQLLLYCISNISKTGEILITTEDNPDNIYIYIQDSGSSIKTRDMDRLFEPFSSDEASCVHGFGMRFVKAVIDLHEGEIECLPGRGQGNIFQITFPVYKEEKKRRKVDRKKMKKAKILIVQGEDIAKELLAHLLSEKGCRVDKSESSVEGLNIVKKRKINLLVADTDSLGINADAYFKKCRQINPELIIAGLYSPMRTKDIKTAEEGGPNLIIKKPFDIRSAAKSIAELFMVEF